MWILSLAHFPQVLSVIVCICTVLFLISVLARAQYGGVHLISSKFSLAFALDVMSFEVRSSFHIKEIIPEQELESLVQQYQNPFEIDIIELAITKANKVLVE